MLDRNDRLDQHVADVLVFKGTVTSSQGPAAGCIQEVDVLDVAHEDVHGVLGGVCRVVADDAKGETISRLIGPLPNEQHVRRASVVCADLEHMTCTRAGCAEHNAGHSQLLQRQGRAQTDVCRTWRVCHRIRVVGSRTVVA
jgi:hypothetical protein